MKRQQGLTLTGMIFVSIIAVLVLLLAFKIVPVYVEYYAIEKQFKAMAYEPKLRGASRGQIEASWAARAAVDDLSAVSPEQIEVTREADGIVVSAEYEKRVPLFGNFSACFNFTPSSKN